jgi:hypothetical protein
MHIATMPHEIGLGSHERLERCFDLVEVNIRDEAIDAGIDGAWPRLGA